MQSYVFSTSWQHDASIQNRNCLGRGGEKQDDKDPKNKAIHSTKPRSACIIVE